MKYSELIANATYRRAQTGSGLRVVILRVSDGATVLIGSTSGLSASDDFEQLPVEEAGEEGVNEIATGRTSGSANCQGHYRLSSNDILPSRASFLGANGDGEEYVVMKVRGDKRLGTGIPVDVFTGAKISRYGTQQGARGLVTFDLAFVYKQRWNGKEWMARSGDPNYAAA